MPSQSKTRRRGTVERRGPDCWLVRLSVGQDPRTGKWIRASKTIRGTRREAEQLLTELLSRKDGGVPLPRARYALHQWLEEYDRVWSGALAAQTRENASQALRCYLTPALRATRLPQLTAAAFQELYNSMSARGLAPATVSFLHRTLRARLAKAVELGHLASNPVARARPPAEARREYRVLDAAEARVFLEEAGRDTFGALWILLLLTGIRPGEALGLKWEDLDGARLAIRRTLVRVGGGRWALEETKTGRARSLVLPGPALRALQRHRARQAAVRLQLGAEYAPHALVFASTFGRPLFWANLVERHFQPLLARVACLLAGETLPGPVLPASLSRVERQARRQRAQAAIQRALATTGLARMRPYDLRHSAATLLLAAGEHPKVVAELLGHAKVTLTLDTYSHVVPGLLDRAARRMEELIAGGESAAGQS